MNRSPGDKVNGGGSALAGNPAARGAPNDLPSGTVLGKYRIVKRIAGGGMGAVYEAVHTGIAKPVALKTMSPTLATDPRATTRFLREAAAASRLNHPHVVDVTDFGNDEGIGYLVMELLRGEDLAAVIAREKRGMEPAAVADILLAVCAGVFAAHESGVVHRDLKPQNIFLARTPLGEVVPKVLDFGISKRIDDDLKSNLTHSGAVMGTTHYLSPEQVSGKPLDVRSDQYSLGVILYETIIGKKPHDGQSVYAIMQSIGEGRHALPRTVRPDIQPTLEAVILRAMSLRPQARFESVHDLGRALLPFASGKRRVMWSDYYERDRPPVTSPPAGLDRGPLPAVGQSTPDEGATVAIDSFKPRAAHAPLTKTRTHREGSVPRPPERKPAPLAETRMARPSDDTGKEVLAVPVIGTDEYLRTTPALRRGGRRFLVVVGLGLLAAGAYVFWIDPSWRDRLPESLRTRIDRTMSTRPAPPVEPAAAPAEDPTGVAGVAVPEEDKTPPGGLGGTPESEPKGGLTRDPAAVAVPVVPAPPTVMTSPPDSQPAAAAPPAPEAAPASPTAAPASPTSPAAVAPAGGTPAVAAPPKPPATVSKAPPAVLRPAPPVNYRRKRRELYPPVRTPPVAQPPPQTQPPPRPPEPEIEDPAPPPPSFPTRPQVPISPSPILE